MKPSEPYAIGLTGSIATGKSHLAGALRAARAVVIDADSISRALTAKGGAALPMIRRTFGDAVFSGGELNRKALADVIFGDAEKRAALNNILHPMIFAEMARLREQVASPIVVLEVPLLYETGYDAQCDEVWCAYVPQHVQISRLRKRDGLTVRAARERLKSQLSGIEKARRATHVIRTDVSEDESARQVVALYQALLERLAHV